MGNYQDEVSHSILLLFLYFCIELDSSFDASNKRIIYLPYQIIAGHSC